jgi:hypothetical protein
MLIALVWLTDGWMYLRPAALFQMEWEMHKIVSHFSSQ